MPNNYYTHTITAYHPANQEVTARITYKASIPMTEILKTLTQHENITRAVVKRIHAPKTLDDHVTLILTYTRASQ